MIAPLTALYLFMVMLFSVLLSLLVYELKKYFEFSITFAYIGLLYSLSNLVGSFLYHKIDIYLFTIGSISMYPAVIFMILLLYIKDGIEKARIGVYSAVCANIIYVSLTTLLCIGMTMQNSVLFIEVPQALLFIGSRVVIAGTIAFIIDVFLVVFVYSYLSQKLNRGTAGFLSVFIAMYIVLMSDAILFPTMAFFGTPEYVHILVAHVVGKTFSALFYAASLILYLRMEGSG